MVWSLPIPNNESHPVLHAPMLLKSRRRVTANLLPQSHTPAGSGFSNKSKLPWKETPALPAVSLFCPMCSWCVAYGEGEELRSGWTNKGGELARAQSMADRSVTASRMSNGAKGAGEPQSGNPFSSSSTALSPLALSIQTTAPSLELSPSPENRFPYSSLLEQSKLYKQRFTQYGITSLHFLKGPNICQTWGLPCIVVALKST